MQDNYEKAQNEHLKKDIRRLTAAARRNQNWSDQLEKTKKGTRVAGLRPDRGHIGRQSAKMMKRSKSIEKRREAAIEEKSGLLKNTETAAPLKLSPLSYHQSRLLSLQNVTISYGRGPLFAPVSFSVETKDRISLQGKNGSGKTSLLKLICEETVSCEGRFQKGSQLKISYVPQDTSFLRGSLADYAAACGVDETLFKTILRKLDFSRTQFEKDMSSFSSGQKKKALIARSLCEQAHLYVWDEPLNYIDVLSRIQIENLILEYRPTLIFVEHDSVFAGKIATKVVALPEP